MNIDRYKNKHSIIEIFLKYLNNHQADILAEQIYETQEYKVPILNKYQNKYLLKSTKKKNTHKGKKDEIIHTKIRQTVKDKTRQELIDTT